MEIHVVAPGETLYSIAGKYGVDPWLLGRDNAAGAMLAVGQTLVVQKPETFHVVRPGDTLSAVARQYGIPLRALYRNNVWLGGNPKIQPGQTLVIRYQGAKLGEIYTNGYAYPFVEPSLLDQSLPYMSYLSPFTYGIGPQGALLPLDDASLIAHARSLGAAPLMHLSTLTETGQFSSGRAEEVLSDGGEALMDQIAAVVAEKGYRGLDVDFEYIAGAQAGNYAGFITSLRTRLSPLPVMAALAPKTSAAQRGLLYEGHDYAALGAAADFVLLMTYEWGYTYGPPMAVAPLPNVRQVVEYALTAIPPGKIFLGIPNYGYDWPLPFVQGKTRARSISNQEAVELAIARRAEIEFDTAAQSPYFRYTEGGVVHEVWFEDARSMAAKLRLIHEYGLHGAGYWNLMRPYPQGWTVLNALYDVVSVI